MSAGKARLHRQRKNSGTAGKAVPQGLKPDIFSVIYGPTKEAAEKLWLLKGTGFSPYVTD
jgi:hypothetical protein